MALLRHALSAGPESPAAHNYLGVTLLRTGRYGEAVTSFERALALNPEDDTIHNNFGYARLDHGEVEAAYARFRHAIEINPKNAMTHNNLGNALRALDDMARGDAALRDVLGPSRINASWPSICSRSAMTNRPSSSSSR